MAQDHIIGCLLGTALGDAIGLPYEGLSPQRAAKLLGPPERHRFFCGRGMVSDDTEHTCMVALSLIEAGQDVEAFKKSLAKRFRWWLLGLPAGIGMATLRAAVRLWLGFGPDRSGVFSAGNGPAMRAAILGAAIDDPDALREFVRASSRLTHTDPKAEYGALAVALAAQLVRAHEIITPQAYLRQLNSFIGKEGEELVAHVEQATSSVSAGQSTKSFADALGLTKGISGYVYHTVPVAIHAWLSHPQEFRAAIVAVIECGGDADSTAAIVGGIVGSAVGKTGIPSEWLAKLLEWPRTSVWLVRLGEQLSVVSTEHIQQSPLRLPMLGLLARNLFFLVIVLYHGFRRLLPPY